MSINYSLKLNSLVDQPDVFAPVVQIRESLGLDEIVANLAKRGSTVTAADVRAVLTEAISLCEDALVAGRRVNFGGFVSLWPRLRGKFIGHEDRFDPERHAISIAASASRRLRQRVATEASVTRVEASKRAPSPERFFDVTTGERNQTLTTGGLGELRGHRLRFDPNAPDEGLFVVDLDNGFERRVTRFQRNEPKTLVFQLPDASELAESSGNVSLEVRNRFGGVDKLKTGRLDAPLVLN